MRQGGRWQRRYDPGLATRGPRCWFALLLVLAFVLSGFAHVGSGAHGFSATNSHELVLVDHDVDGEPCNPEHNGKSHITNDCSVSSVCSLCVPMGTSIALVLSRPDGAETALKSGSFGSIPSPQFRPPKLFSNV